MFKKWIPFRRSIKFVSDSSITATNAPELASIVMTCADTLSSGGEDNVVAGVKCNTTLAAEAEAGASDNEEDDDNEAADAEES